MKRILIGFGIFVLLLVAAAVAVPYVVPVEAYRARIEEAVQDATGRRFTIAGPIRLSILPKVALEASDVRLGNTPGAASPDMASIKRIELEVGLLPLLSGTIEVDRLVLVEPTIDLEVAKNGQPNWVLGAPVAPATPSAVNAKPAAPSANKTPSAGSNINAGNPFAGHAIHLGEIKLEGGSIAYRDDRTGAAYRFDKIALSVDLPDMAGPFGIDGQLDWNGQTVKLGIKGQALGKVLAGGGTPVALSIASAPVSFGFDGKLGTLEPLALLGTVKLDVPSVRDLARWAGSPIAGGGHGFGKLAIEGQLALAGTRVAFSNASVALDDMKGTGEVTLETGGARPAIYAKLDLDRLDLNTYAATPPSTAAATPPLAARKPAQAGAAPGARAQWSNAPIDFSALKSVDATLGLTLGALEAEKVKIGKSRLEATLKDGVLSADLAELELYGGKGTGKLQIDARAAVPTIAASFDLAGLEAEPFLQDAAGIDWLSGKAALDFDVSARGASQMAIVSALDGKGKFDVRNGSVKGVDIAAMARNATGAFLDSESGSAQSTDFSALTGSFTIAKGIATNRDLEMQSPLLRLTGAGSADIPRRTVDYTLKPKLVASLSGQGGAASVSGITIPVRVTGSWDKIHYAPDFVGAAETNASGLVKSLVPGGGTKLPSAKSILKSLFGN
ncbi:MAG TPA: AsmA family protein [Alphaproteobacteria bacterium]|nr:AsmA family protein [Alphaproteobacteria bacterium]